MGAIRQLSLLSISLLYFFAAGAENVSALSFRLLVALLFTNI